MRIRAWNGKALQRPGARGHLKITVGGGLKNLLALVVSTLFGWAGWVLGEKIGFMTAYFASGFASILGFYVGWKITRRLVE
jgi:hypothetical protein